ncbi:MAG: hypothetical protein V9G04_09525 [Nocardioides sp.]|jgi:hypothetical protein
MSIRRTFISIAFSGALALGTGIGVAGIASADPGNGRAHQEQVDGCDHGATGRPCRPDPQPTKGQDCLVHGNWGGINEDHCFGDLGGGGGEG